MSSFFKSLIQSFHFLNIPASTIFSYSNTKKKNKPPKKAQGFYFKNQYTVTCAINSARIIKTKFDLC